MDKIESFVKMIKNADKIVFFGGAGVSTESGLKDYRSSDGIYRTAKQYGVSPEEILSRNCFFKDPELFYRFYRDYFLTDVEPNITHKSLAELENKGKCVKIVTQNIDGLHQKAGSSCVYELHGTTSMYHCVKCGKIFDAQYIIDSLTNVPRCKCGGIVKPNVVLYGEMLNEEVVLAAIDAIKKADLLIIGGTSMSVYPAASFVRYFKGENVVIINKESTLYDDFANLVFNEKLGDVFSEVMKRL